VRRAPSPKRRRWLESLPAAPAPALYVPRLPREGVTLEYVTTIDVPFEGQG
jgi:hypothetical protein